MCDEAYYDRVRNELARQYLVIRPLMEVNVRTATNLQENTLRNLPHMFGAPDISELAGKFEDIPFILIGAFGPRSMNRSISSRICRIKRSLWPVIPLPKADQ